MADARITGVRLLRLDPYGDGDPAGTWNLIRVDTDQGVWGLGEAYWGTGLRPVIDDLLAPQLVGGNPLDVDRLVTLLTTRWAGTHTRNGLVMAAISGIEIALWDLAGKLTGLPTHRLLGGMFRDRVRVYRTCTPPDPDDGSACREWAAQMKEAGWTAIKTLDVDSMWQRYDPECREPAHEPLGRSLSARRTCVVQSDSWPTCGTALETTSTSPFTATGPSTCPTPSPWPSGWLLGDLAGSKIRSRSPSLPVAFAPAWVRLCERSPVPICTGENLYGRHEFRPFIEAGGVHVVHIDIPKSGGLLETKRIADLADLHYLKVAAHNPASVVGTIASVVVASTIRGFSMIERAGEDLDWWEDLILHEGPVIDGGYVAVPEGPGLGIELNPDVAQAHLAEGEQWWD